MAARLRNASTFWTLVFDLTEDARSALVGTEHEPAQVIELSAATTRRLRRWGADFAAAVDERTRRIAAAGFEIRGEDE